MQTPQADHAMIAAKGWWSTANQRIVPTAYPFFIGQDWAMPYRHERIEHLLAATARHDVASMQNLQGHQLSVATLRLLPFLNKTLLQPPTRSLAGAAQHVLAGFDGTMRADQAAPLLYAASADELTRGVLAGKLGPSLFNTLYGKRHFRGALENIMERDDASWCGFAQLRSAVCRST
jgi:penicillin G amidase